jgi:hypothetical protein
MNSIEATMVALSAGLTVVAKVHAEDYFFYEGLGSGMSLDFCHFGCRIVVWFISRGSVHWARA